MSRFSKFIKSTVKSIFRKYGYAVMRLDEYQRQEALLRELDVIPKKLSARYIFMSKQYESLLKNPARLKYHNFHGIEYNIETFITFDQIPASCPYKKTYPFSGPFINNTHKGYAEALTGNDVGIEGYLSTDDALKLYELAFFCDGHILEVGTFKGLSASIMCQALEDRGTPSVLETVDSSEEFSKIAQKNISTRPGFQYVRFNVMDANLFMDSLISDNRSFGLIFIDHHHGYHSTLQAAERSKKLLRNGGFILFHDYTNPQNKTLDPDYGVYQAVTDAIMTDTEHYAFCGVFGCSILYRRVTNS